MSRGGSIPLLFMMYYLLLKGFSNILSRPSPAARSCQALKRWTTASPDLLYFLGRSRRSSADLSRLLTSSWLHSTTTCDSVKSQKAQTEVFFRDLRTLPESSEIPRMVPEANMPQGCKLCPVMAIRCGQDPSARIGHRPWLRRAIVARLGASEYPRDRRSGGEARFHPRHPRRDERKCAVRHLTLGHVNQPTGAARRRRARHASKPNPSSTHVAGSGITVQSFTAS